MRLTLLAAVAVWSLLAFIAPAFAQESPGDVASGRRIAETWCAACHKIDPQGAGASTDAPSFVDVAKLASTTALALNVFLRTSHDQMPNFQLNQRETDDVIAYILSLKDQ